VLSVKSVSKTLRILGEIGVSLDEPKAHNPLTEAGVTISNQELCCVIAV